MSVAFFEHQRSGCFLYRTKHPMDLFARNGVHVTSFHLETDIDETEYNNIKSVQLYGIHPFSFEKVLIKLKEDGKKIIYECDDAVDFIDPANPFYFAVKKDSNSQALILKYADHITTTTPFLADYFKDKTNAPVTIIPNCYDEKEWSFVRRKRDGIRIGFAGSPTHIDDLNMVLPAIKNLQKKYPITFILFGFGRNDYQTFLKEFRYVASLEAQKSINTFEELMKGIDFEFVPYVDYEIYPAVLTNISLDIGLCPLINTPFNRARSASKALEYTMSGALALVSSLDPYKGDINSILIQDDEWERALEYYIQHPSVRELETKHNLEWTKQNRNIDSQLDTLKFVYGV